jgi:ubiquitin-protein ligase
MMRVMKEIKQLVTKPPEGIRVQFSEENITSITAEIDGPESTPFEGGVFKVRLSLPSDFPSSAPKGTFLTKIFHPNVSKTGEICVNTLKRDWKPELGIRHVLLVVRCLLIHPNPASALNEEAGKLILDAYEDFARHAKLITTIHAKAKKSSSSRCVCVCVFLSVLIE